MKPKQRKIVDRCLHAHVRVLRAETPDQRGKSCVMCVHCAAYWVAGMIGWHNRGSLEANIAPPEDGYPPGSLMILLSPIIPGEQFWEAVDIAELDVRVA